MNDCPEAPNDQHPDPKFSWFFSNENSRGSFAVNHFQKASSPLAEALVLNREKTIEIPKRERAPFTAAYRVTLAMTLNINCCCERVEIPVSRARHAQSTTARTTPVTRGRLQIMAAGGSTATRA
jgi:hypothetical protein